jgi:hypothetical protein
MKHDDAILMVFVVIGSLVVVGIAALMKIML